MDANHHRILFVEDDDQVRILVEGALEDEGFDVDTASTVGGARQLLATNRFDLVFTDGRLPDGDGFSLVAEASAIGMKVLVYTAYGSEFSVSNRANYPVLAKPVRISELIFIIRHFLGENVVSTP